MGHRIELGEIEANAGALEEIRLCGCIYDDRKGRIVLYYTGDAERDVIADKLKDKLPRYMQPNRIIRLDTMPFTANGKIDRVTLKNIYKYQKGK